MGKLLEGTDGCFVLMAMLQTGSEIELEVQTSAEKGRGVAKVDGFVVFVRNAVPGDRVLARIVKSRRNFAEAVSVKLLVPSPQRVEPRCRYFGVCGGCEWQNLSYEAQLKLKQHRVEDVFNHIGGFKNLEVKPTLGSEDIYFYRNKMEFSFSHRRWLTAEEIATGEELRREFALGLHVANRYDKVIDIHECWLQSELSNRIVNAVRDWALDHSVPVYQPDREEGYLRFLVVRQSTATSEVMVNLVTYEDRPEVAQSLCDELGRKVDRVTTFVNTVNRRKAQIAYGDFQRIHLGTGTISERLSDFSFRISANSFFQTNTCQAEQLCSIVREFGELQRNDVVYDLYSGAGTLSIVISAAVSKIVGIEVLATAVEDARWNADLNGITNCVFVKGDVKETFVEDRSLRDEQGEPSVLILDPPRSGIHPKLAQDLARTGPRRIVYVGCNPSTQARDLKVLCEGGYSIDILQPVDMFPHTDHIESIARLTRSS